MTSSIEAQCQFQYLVTHCRRFFLNTQKEGKNVAFSPYNTIHDGTDGMGSEFRKVISKCVNEAKVGRKNTAPVVSKAYIESLDKDDISLTTMSLLNKKKPGKMNKYYSLGVVRAVQ